MFLKENGVIFAGDLSPHQTMNEYRFKEFDLPKGGKYKYYKLHINGSCQFDEFMEEVAANAIDNKWFGYIIRYMEAMTHPHSLDTTKFNPIKGTGRDDVYEFKKKNIRVYVIEKKPDMYIILGGYKTTQKADIKLLKSRIKDLKLEKS